jgi:hypothetical protein
MVAWTYSSSGTRRIVLWPAFRVPTLMSRAAAGVGEGRAVRVAGREHAGPSASASTTTHEDHFILAVSDKGL